MDTLTTSTISTIDELNSAFLQYYPKEAARKIETMSPEQAARLLSEQS